MRQTQLVFWLGYCTSLRDLAMCFICFADFAKFRSRSAILSNKWNRFAHSSMAVRLHSALVYVSKLTLRWFLYRKLVPRCYHPLFFHNQCHRVVDRWCHVASFSILYVTNIFFLLFSAWIIIFQCAMIVFHFYIVLMVHTSMASHNVWALRKPRTSAGTLTFLWCSYTRDRIYYFIPFLSRLMLLSQVVLNPFLSDIVSHITLMPPGIACIWIRNCSNHTATLVGNNAVSLSGMYSSQTSVFVRICLNFEA